jgi:hypothetical protein
MTNSPQEYLRLKRRQFLKETEAFLAANRDNPGAAWEPAHRPDPSDPVRLLEPAAVPGGRRQEGR